MSMITDVEEDEQDGATAAMPTAFSSSSSPPPPPPPPPPPSSPAPASFRRRLLSDAVHRIVNRIANANDEKETKGDEPSSSFGPLTTEEMKSLLLLVMTTEAEREEIGAGVSNSNSNSKDSGSPSIDGFASVEGEELANLVESLQLHVSLAMSGGMIVDPALEAWRDGAEGGSGSGRWLNDRAWRHLDALLAGLDASSLILAIASSPGVDLRAVNEDAIGAAIALARKHLVNNLLPSLQQNAHLALLVKGKVSNDNEGGRSVAAATASSSRDMKKAYGLVLTHTVEPYLKLAERLDRLVRCVPLEDQQLLMLTSGAMRTLELDPVSGSIALVSTSTAKIGLELQKASNALLASVFRRFPLHRNTLLEDLFVMLPKIPAPSSVRCTTANGSNRAAAVPVSYASVEPSQALARWNASVLVPGGGTGGGAVEASTGNTGSIYGYPQPHPQPQKQHYVQNLTVLILSLLLSVVERPAYVSDDNEADPTTERDGDGDKDEVDSEDEGEDNKEDDEALRSGKRAARKSQRSSNERAAVQDKIKDGSSSSASSTLDFRSGLAALHYWADAVCMHLLKRCKSPKSSDRDYRPLLASLIDDLLLLWIIPEYSVAEVVLVAMVRRFTVDIAQSSPQILQALNSPMEKAASLETTYLNAAFDQLGRIAAAQARMLAVYRSCTLVPTAAAALLGDINTTAPAAAATNRIACFCGEKSNLKFRVACDSCALQYHGPCVGLGRDDLPDTWDCDACRVAKVLQHARSDSGGSIVVGGRGGSSNDDRFRYLAQLLDGTYALQHVYVSQLAQREGLPSFRDATRYHLARWAERLASVSAGTSVLVDADSSPSAAAPAAASSSTDFERTKRAVVVRVLEHWDGPGGPAAEHLSEFGTIRMILSTMAQTSPFLLQFKSQIKNLLAFLSDPIHALRKLSLKAIEKVMEGDPQLMSQKNVIKAVSQRLSDDQTSVREAALSLVGSYVSKSPEVASSFESALLLRLSDVGVSVRKRCVKILHDLLAAEPRFRGRSRAFCALLGRVADPREEDAVRDLIHDLFLKLWLEDGDAPFYDSTSTIIGNPMQQLRLEAIGGSGAADNSKKKPLTRSDLAAEQMVEVARSRGSAEDLETLLRNLLRGAADNDKGRKQAERKKRAELARTRCDLLVASLFELLLTIEERRDSGATAPEYLGGSRGDLLRAKDIAATLQTISAFAERVPTSVLRRVDAVLPYLKADNGVPPKDELAIVTASCEVLYRLASTCGPETTSLAAKVSGDLRDITFKYASTAVDAAIRTLSLLAEHACGRGDFEVDLFQLSQRFYKYLYKKNGDDTSSDPKSRKNIHRALSVLGCVCEYRGVKLDSVEWEGEVSAAADKRELLLPEAFARGNLLVACYRMFRRYLARGDSATKCASLRALMGLFVSQPRLMLLLEQDRLLATVLSEKDDLNLCLTALQSLRRILLVEEKRIDGGKAEAKMESNTSITTAKKISGDQDGDASLFGGVLTNHADRLLDMTQSANPKVRQASLELIAVLLKQGQVNPNDAIPYLFALQGDCAEPDIRALALQLLMTEGDKRPDMLRQRIRAGIKKAYDFQRALYPNKEVSALTAVRHGDAISTECVFSNVFKECLIRNRKQRHGFYSSLIGLFLQVDSADVDTSSTTHAAASREKRPSKRRKSSSSAAPAATAAASVVDVDLVRFASQILAYLPYEASGDVVHIAHEIVKARSLHEDEIVETFASLLRSVGLTSGDALDESLVDEDALETAAAAKFPSRTNQAKALSRAEFDIMAFAALCREAAALTLLLRLKCYLCVAYNVNDVRIHEYNPEGKESVADKGISKPAVESALAPFDSSVGFCSGRGLDSRAPSLDSLIRVYAEFRRALRLEHNQFDSERFQSSRTTDYDADGDGESIGNCCGQRTKGEVQSAIIDLNGAQGSTSEGSRKTMSAASPAGGDRQPASRKRSG